MFGILSYASVHYFMVLHSESEKTWNDNSRPPDWPQNCIAPQDSGRLALANWYLKKALLMLPWILNAKSYNITLIWHRKKE